MEFPLIGLGTWQLRGELCEIAVKQALELGYRHIDTADAYENHTPIGAAIQGFPRDKLFLTSKLWMNDLSPHRVDRATERFLKELRTEYLDLLLIHWPNPGVDLIATLKEMQKLQERGLIRHIGVSNFVRAHLKEMEAAHIQVFTNQIEMHPYLQRRELVKEYQKKGIKITAYRPVAKGAFESDEVMQKIGKSYGKSPSQVALRWLVQQDITVIPKAASEKHLKENLAIFDFKLTDAEMKEITALDAGQRFCAPSGMPLYED